MSTKTSNEPGVALKGVSRTVTGRARSGNRVTYLLDGKPRGTERIVVVRCHRAGYEAHRLPPTIWRRMGEGAALGTVDARIASTLRRVLRPGDLQALIDRHTSGAVDPARPGTPDLVVYKRRPDGTPCGVRFVEVKRGGRDPERLAPHQLAELRFLKSLGLKAGVLRLEERPAAPARRTP